MELQLILRKLSIFPIIVNCCEFNIRFCAFKIFKKNYTTQRKWESNTNVNGYKNGIEPPTFRYPVKRSNH